MKKFLKTAGILMLVTVLVIASVMPKSEKTAYAAGTQVTIEFEDATLCKMMMNALNTAVSDSCTAESDTKIIADQDAVAKVKKIEIKFGTGTVSSLKGLEAFTALTTLRLDNFGNSFTDLTPLSGLTNLTTLALRSSALTDLSPLSALTGLNTLKILDDADELADLSVLSGMTALKELTLGSQAIADLSPLENLTALEKLSVTFTSVESVEPLKKLTAMKVLNLKYNAIKDISPLAGLQNLESLNVYDNQIETFPTNMKCPNMTQLNIGENIREGKQGMDNISGINVTNFPKLEQLNADAVGVSDISGVFSIETLKYLTVGANQLTDASMQGITALVNLEQLIIGTYATEGDGISTTTPGGWKNDIKEFSVYAQLPQLQKLGYQGQDVASLEPFNELMEKGVQLNLNGNMLVDFTGLDENNVKNISMNNQHYAQKDLKQGSTMAVAELESDRALAGLLDAADLLHGDITCTNCAISDDGKYITFEQNEQGDTKSMTASIKVTSGKLQNSEYSYVLDAVPTYTVPQGIETTAGTQLKEVTLPAGFSWMDESVNVGDTAGTKTFLASYTADGYKAVENIPIQVLIKEKETPDDKPAETPDDKPQVNQPENPNEGQKTETITDMDTEAVTEHTSSVKTADMNMLMPAFAAALISVMIIFTAAVRKGKSR